MLEIQEVEISKLRPWIENPRMNNDAVKAVAESINTFGFNVPILCNQGYTIIAGHTRWKAAKEIGLKKVPVIKLEIDESKRRAFAIADNKTGEIAEWDYPQLRKILRRLKTKVDLSSLGYESAQLKALLVKQREFDWKSFQERMEKTLVPKYTCFPVKIPFGSRDRFTKAVRKFAKLHKIKNKDIAVLSGQVLALLVGVDNGKDTIK